MRKIVVHMQTTLDNRIANGAGMFWEPFPWGCQLPGVSSVILRQG